MFNVRGKNTFCNFIGLFVIYYTHAHAHAHERTHTRTHARAHTHTHIYIYICVCEVFCQEAGQSLDMHYHGSTRVVY